LSQVKTFRKQNIYIDEATMLSIFDLMCISHACDGKVIMYGDKSQIGNVDMSRTGGWRQQS